MVELRVLGSLRLQASDGRDVAPLVRQPKRTALLAFLAAALPRGPHRRDTLLAMFWPESDTAHARAALSQALYVLRAALGEAAIVPPGDGAVSLNEKAVWCDAAAFEAALDAGRPADALALYRGDLLEGFFVTDAPEFERWLERERARLRERASEGAWVLAEERATAGDTLEAARWARRATDLVPADEAVARRLIAFLHRLGDRAAAIRAYEEFAARLAQEYELEPSAETRALAEAIRETESRRPEAVAAQAPSAAAPQAGAAPLPLDRAESVLEARPLPPAGPARRHRRGKVLSLVAMLAFLFIGAWATGVPRVLWARYRGIPSLRALVAAGDWEDANRLAARLEAVIPRDSSVAALRAIFADTVSVEGTPAGARVYRRPYNRAKAAWEFLGVAPIARVVVPRQPLVSQLRFEAPGFATGLDIGAAWSPPRATTRTVLRFALPRDSAAPEGMVLVVGGEVGTGIPQLDDRDRAILPDFFIGRLEVTNREYQGFVDSGGYQRRDLWSREFLADGRRITWQDAISRFVDQTGRPGPSTWEAGRYPTGRADYPVGGVSWYEAMAYARFRGARLPSVFHWTRAARFEAAGAILAASNIDRVGGGTAPVGSFGGMSGSGAMDMAGNVREWCTNASHRAGGYYLLGGGWNDPPYTFYERGIQPALDRSPTNGIRLVRPLSGQEGDASMDRAIEPYFRNYRAERPASDRTFRFYRRLYAYDRLPVHAVVERRDSLSAWIREKVSFDAAYGGERLTAYLFLPRRGRPPYQTIVFFPGSSTLRIRSSDSLMHVGMFDFLVPAGRAVAYPVLKGTYDRDDGTLFSDPDKSNRYKEHVVEWVKDVSRTLDYLSTRADIDTTEFGYLGFSWGGRLGGVVLSIESRFRAAVLTVAGFSFIRPQPEVDDLNYMPHVHMPVLMMNGRYDNTFPLETAARPMYELLGTPPDRKRLLIVDGVHYVPRNILIRETLDWFDRYLGPVR